MREASPAILEENQHRFIASTKKKTTNKSNDESHHEGEVVIVVEDAAEESNKAVVFLEEESGFVVSSRSQYATRKVTPTPDEAENVVADGKKVEKLLPNGDLYIGSFSGKVPHGTGKYLWADGCMYEGEWRRGKAAGKGRFSWPSGATFEGEFKSGRMEGFGTFTGADGDTYQGLWVADRKHGYGQKRYANGDYYEGGWRRNLQDGQGRYMWRNGNQYVGEWKGGVISGRGVLIWANGNRYDGQWENGVPKGGGVFTWPDGSCYVVNSSPQPKNRHLHGTFYPSTNLVAAMQSIPVVPVRMSSPSVQPLFKLADSLDGHFFLQPRKWSASIDAVTGRGSCAEKHFPRICIWESDGEAGDITCDIVDTIEASMLYKDGINDVAATAEAGEVQRQQRRSPWCFIGSEPKKPGHTISKGHKNYHLMRNLQLGISYSVGKPSSSAQARELRPSDFYPREKFWTRFPPEGSKITPPHQSMEFRWKDYCPMVFRHLRKLFAVDPADYMLAICGNDALRELSSPGKSGSFFYLTQDDRFIIKTVRKPEVKVLIRMLPSYYRHVSQHKDTLLTKFFGVHCVKPVGGQKVRFIVMGNFFCSEYHIHRRFDLKGSSHGRTTDKAGKEIDETTTLKDLDLNFVFSLQHSWFQDLLRQINQDCGFLESEGIMDYSLLVGLHFRDDIIASKPRSPSSGGVGSGAGFGSTDNIPDNGKPLTRLGANMPARAELIPRGDWETRTLNRRESSAPGLRGEVYDVVLYFGVIDILQDYDFSKKLEHAYKSLQVDPTSISAVDPKLYSKRFRDFIQRIFVEDRW